MLRSRKVTEVSEIFHVNLRAEWKELTKPINSFLFIFGAGCDPVYSGRKVLVWDR